MIREPRSGGAPRALAVWGVLAVAAPALAPAAEFALLPMTEARAVSADGATVAGCAPTRRAACGEAVRWHVEDGLTRLRGLPPASVASRGFDVADDGTVVGESLSAAGRTAAVRWRPGGGVRELAGLPGPQPFARASAVSADGTRVGGIATGVANGYGAGHAVLWSADGAARAVGHLPGDRRASARTPAPTLMAEVTDVSADGRVSVGWSGTWPGQGPRRAFRRIAGGQPEYLGGLLADVGDGEARGVSADGAVIVGTSRSPDGMQAFRWSADSGMTGLGDLPGGASASAANAVSADGRVVVGVGSPAAPELGGAAVWTPGQPARVLSELLREEYCVDLDGARLMAALDVSADGRVIVGLAQDADGRPRGFRAVLDYLPGSNRAPRTEADAYWAFPDTTLAVGGDAPGRPPTPGPRPAVCPPGVAPAVGVLANDDDPEGHPLIATLADTVDSGALALRADGGFRYTPAPGFVGRDGFSYRASDGRLSTAPVQVAIEVGNTPAGSDVDVDLGDGMRLRFEKVVVGGHTVLTPRPEAPVPEGFLPPSGQSAWSLTSSAVHLGLVYVTLAYDEARLPGPESALRMLHYRDGFPDLDGPADRLADPDPPGNVTVTLDAAHDEVAGVLRDPSTIALVVSEPEGGALLPGILLALMLAAGALMLVWLSHMRAVAEG